MGLKGLAEGIILQSIEDLWDDEERASCLAFFQGEGVSICAEIAQMNLYDEVRLFNLVQNIVTERERMTSRKGRKNPVSLLQH
jgi:hypothetical protein